jgi:hypothetical protein
MWTGFIWLTFIQQHRMNCGTFISIDATDSLPFLPDLLIDFGFNMNLAINNHCRAILYLQNKRVCDIKHLEKLNKIQCVKEETFRSEHLLYAS